MRSAQGYWQHLGTPANVDWCEPNYVVSTWVAEWWNTASSVCMFLLGLVGWWLARRHALPRRFALLFMSLAIVGAGSIAFHGTLLRVSQALDELPMVWLGLVAVWSVTTRGRAFEQGQRLAATMAIASVAFVIAYLVSPAAFTIFLLIYGSLVAWLVIQGSRRTFGPEGTPLLRTLYITSMVGYLGTFVGCWIPEHVWLACDHPLQSLPLHAFWHIGAGTGTYAFILWTIADDALARSRSPRLVRGIITYDTAEA